MSSSAFIPFQRMFVLFAFLASVASPVAAATDAHLSETYGKLPLQFEVNEGQADASVDLAETRLRRQPHLRPVARRGAGR